METRPEYAISYERDIYERYLAGEQTPSPAEIDWWRPLLDWVRTLTQEGRSLQRVRIVDDPPTAYQRFSLWGGQWNIEAGERISYLRRDAAQTLGLPTGDWWLLDDATLVLLVFSDDGDLVGQEVERNLSVVAKYRHWRDAAVAAGMTTAGVTGSEGGD
ncbi:hypothetical protein ND748_07750 [Frankia sp. AiPs1]|nr:DUF6879 family protein [Frankia sp. AiPs1]MCM3921558.1 hypothetical protein [Frankia sp. AiPs1]